MPTLQVTIEGESHELDFNDVQLPEGYDLVSPENASSKGYFTQVQLDQKVQNRLKRAKSKAKEELLDDEDVHRDILNKHNIKLDDSGKPVGLEPEFDPEEWKAKKAKELTEPLKNDLEKAKETGNTYKSKLIEQSILSATKGAWKDEYTSYQDEGRVKPIAVNQFAGLFDVDEHGNIALRDRDGDGFEINPKTGKHVTPEDYLNNRDKFGNYMRDNRQGSSGFQGSGSHGGKRVYTQQEIKKMSDAEYEKNREDILKAQSEGRVQ